MSNFYPATKFAAFALSLLLVACTNDLYKEDVPTPDKDPIHGSTDATYSNIKTVRLSVNLEDEFDGERFYTVEAFTINPILYPEEAKVIENSSQKVNKDLTYENLKVNIPDLFNSIYVRVTDPRGYRRVYECPVTGQDIVCNIRSQVTTKSAGLRAMTLPTMERPSFVPEADAIEIATEADKSKLGYDSNKICKITGNVTWDNLPWNVSKVYVVAGAKFRIVGSITGNPSVYVLKGGSLEFTNLSLNQAEKTVFAIEEGATVQGKSLTLGNSARLYNEGSLTIEGALHNSSSPSIHNTKNAKMTVGSILLDNNSSFINEGSLRVNGDMIIRGTSSTRVYNACNLQCRNFSLEANGTLNLMESSYLGVENKFTLVLGAIYLDGLAHLQTSQCEFRSTTTVQSSEEAGSLIEADHVKVLYGSLNIQLKGQVELYAKDGFDVPQDSRITAENVTNGLDGKGAGTSIPQDKGGCNPVGNKGESEDDGFTEDSETSDLVEGNTQPYTYMFEDNWPTKGDYDMNDLVMNIAFKNHKSGKETVGMEIEATLCAIGAKKKIGVAFQIDGLLAGSVTETLLNGTPTSLESGQKYAVVDLFENAHQALGAETGVFVNTTVMNHIARTYHVYLGVQHTKGSVNVNNFNLFLVTGDMNADRRPEIHLPMFRATDRANVSKEYQYITEEDNLMWAIYVPTVGKVTYPKELVSVIDAYENVAPWLVGGEAPGWYAHPVDGKVISYTEPVVP